MNHVAYFAGMLLVLAVAATSFAVHSRYSVLEETAVGKHQVQAKQLAVHSQLDDEPTEPSADTGSITEQQDAFVAEVEAIFGWHFVFLSLVLLGTILLWVYVRCIRPQSWFRDFQKPFVSASAGFGTAATGTTAHLDENDLPGSLTLVPGEAVFFNEELALSFGGAFGSCSKLSVTNLRVIAQKSDTIFCGTCSVCIFLHYSSRNRVLCPAFVTHGVHDVDVSDRGVRGRLAHRQRVQGLTSIQTSRAIQSPSLQIESHTPLARNIRRCEFLTHQTTRKLGRGQRNRVIHCRPPLVNSAICSLSHTSSAHVGCVAGAAGDGGVLRLHGRVAAQHDLRLVRRPTPHSRSLSLSLSPLLSLSLTVAPPLAPAPTAPLLDCHFRSNRDSISPRLFPRLGPRVRPGLPSLPKHPLTEIRRRLSLVPTRLHRLRGSAVLRRNVLGAGRAVAAAAATAMAASPFVPDAPLP